MTTTTEKSRIRNKISRLVDELNARPPDEDEALSIFNSACEADPTVIEEYGDSEVATACVRVAIERRGASLPVKYICNTSLDDPDPRKTARAEYEIVVASDSDVELSSPIHILLKNSGVLPEACVDTAESLLTSLPDTSMPSTTSETIAASAAYAAALIEGNKYVNQTLLSETFGVTTVTIRDHYEEIIAKSEQYTKADKSIKPKQVGGECSESKEEAIQRLATELGWTEGKEYSSPASQTSIRNAGIASLTGTDMTVRQATRLIEEYGLSEDDFRLDLSLKTAGAFKIADEVDK